MRPMLKLAALALFACSQAFAVVPPQENLIEGPVGGPWRRLFLDATVVEKSEGLERAFHAAEKHEANPVLVADRPWEQGGRYSGPYLYGTMMWDEGKLRMWYHLHHGGGYRNAYAESVDGIHWEKPNLGIVKEGGSTENNLVIGKATGEEANFGRLAAGLCHNPSVIKQPWEDDPEKRYMLYCFGATVRHARMAYSPDGLHWTFTPRTRETALFRSGDVLNFFRDRYESRYVATWKTGSRRGRSVGIAMSEDGLEWTKPVDGPVFVADDLDPDATQIYGMPVFPYQGLYIGLPWIYNARWFKYGSYSAERMREVEADSPCTMDVQIAWSHDLINWTRPRPRYGFIPRGEKGEFDSGMIYTARRPVQMGDELWFYYGGWVGAHNEPEAHANIGVATLRLDGFCSMHAGDDEGWLISRREPFIVPKVTINARCDEGGYVVAELLDADGNVIDGFSREDCERFGGDAVDHVLSWKTAKLPDAVREADKKIRFILRNADLYSYLPDRTREPVHVRYVPADNGGLLPSDDNIPAPQRFKTGGKRSGYSIIEVDGRPVLDLHSIAAAKTNASVYRDETFSDETDWRLEQVARVIDRGTEPVYGLATFFRPNHGRAAGLHLNENAAGIMTQRGSDYTVLASHEMETTDAMRHYALVHEGGAGGTVTLLVDSQQVAQVAFSELHRHTVQGRNVVFGPNASHRTGHIQFAKFGYRIGSTQPVFDAKR